jgi:hypothetical protein
LLKTPSANARNVTLQKKLWEESERWILLSTNSCISLRSWCGSTLKTTKQMQILYTVFALVLWFWVLIYISSMFYINSSLRYDICIHTVWIYLYLFMIC